MSAGDDAWEAAGGTSVEFEALAATLRDIAEHVRALSAAFAAAGASLSRLAVASADQDGRVDLGRIPRPITTDEEAEGARLTCGPDQRKAPPGVTGGPHPDLQGLVRVTRPPRLAVGVGAQEVDLRPAHPSLPRVDLIGFYQGGAWVLAGVPAVSPMPPIVPEGWLVLGTAYVGPGATSVTEADVIQGFSAVAGGFPQWRA